MRLKCHDARVGDTVKTEPAGIEMRVIAIDSGGILTCEWDGGKAHGSFDPDRVVMELVAKASETH